MLNITDIVNKTNIKRVGFWFIKHPKESFVIVFMCMKTTGGKLPLNFNK